MFLSRVPDFSLRTSRTKLQFCSVFPYKTMPQTSPGSKEIHKTIFYFWAKPSAEILADSVLDLILSSIHNGSASYCLVPGQL